MLLTNGDIINLNGVAYYLKNKVVYFHKYKTQEIDYITLNVKVL